MEHLIDPIRNNFEEQRAQATFRIACVFVIVNSLGGILGQLFSAHEPAVRYRNAAAIIIEVLFFVSALLIIQIRVKATSIRQVIYSCFVLAAYLFPLLQNGDKSIILAIAIMAAILPFLLIQMNPVFLIIFGSLHALITVAWWIRLPALAATFGMGLYVYALCGFLAGLYTVWEGIRLFRGFEAELLRLVRGTDAQNAELTALNEEYQAAQDTLQAQYDAIALLQRQGESLMERILAMHSTAQEGICDCDRNTGISLLSRNAVFLLGLETEGITTDHFGWYRFPCGVLPQLNRLWETLRHQHPDADSLSGDLVILDHPLGRRELHATFLQYRVSGETQPHILTSLLDVTVEREQERHIRELAFNDPLTGLLNRAGFEDGIASHIKAGSPPFAVIVFNMRDFRSINETLGYDAGNDVLRRIAGVLGAHRDLIGLQARIGGDDFALLLADPNQLEHVTQLLIDTRTNFGTDAAELYLGVNFGVSLYPEHSDRALELIQDAELAMVLSQEKGPNEWQCFDSMIRDGVRRRVLLSGALERALERDEISLVYQPVVRSDTLRPISFEALVRWRSGKHGPVPPDVFIRIAESNGLIHRLGQHVLEVSCRFALALRERGYNLPISVNVSGVQLLQNDFSDNFLATLERLAVPAGTIAVEVTETAVIGNLDQAVEQLSRLQWNGVRIYLDDFGTGYSSLTYLTQLPIEELKIDKSFIQQLDDNSVNASILSTVITLAGNLGLRTVAEGVETTVQRDFLVDHRCDLMQGYLYSPALPREDALLFTRKGPRSQEDNAAVVQWGNEPFY